MRPEGIHKQAMKLPVRWQTHKKYSDISPYDVWQASLTHQSDFLGLFTSYITPEASKQQLLCARTGHSTASQSALLFGKSPLYELLIRGSG